MRGVSGGQRSVGQERQCKNKAGLVYKVGWMEAALLAPNAQHAVRAAARPPSVRASRHKLQAARLRVHRVAAPPAVAAAAPRARVGGAVAADGAKLAGRAGLGRRHCGGQVGGRALGQLLQLRLL